MHSSIWKFSGDPSLCLRAPDGIVLVGTCPSKDAFEEFGAGFSAMRDRRGPARAEPA